MHGGPLVNDGFVFGTFVFWQLFSIFVTVQDAVQKAKDLSTVSHAHSGPFLLKRNYTIFGARSWQFCGTPQIKRGNCQHSKLRQIGHSKKPFLIFRRHSSIDLSSLDVKNAH
jgi:hypothetical protein